MSKSPWTPQSGELVEDEPFEEEDEDKELLTSSIKPACQHRGTPIATVGSLMGSSYRGGLLIPGNSVTVILTREALQLAFPSGWASGRSPQFNSHLGGGRLVYWPWRDMHVPDEPFPLVVERFRELHSEHHRWGKTIEVACYGGHGRTGTVLAVLAGLHMDWDPDQAVGLLRQLYCDGAVETREQEEFVAKVIRAVRG